MSDDKIADMKTATIPATEFKAKCLSILDEVDSGSMRVTITKHGRAVATLNPVREQSRSRMDSWKGLAWLARDIVNFHEVLGEDT